MNSKIIEKDMNDSLMLYNKEKDEIHALNESSRIIYQNLKKGKSIKEIKDKIKASFKVGKDVDIDKDIRMLLNELRGKGIVFE